MKEYPPDNPFAFPSTRDGYSHHGMTLRDYFATKAMEGILSRREPIGDYSILATLAHRQADAMLKAREQ